MAASQGNELKFQMYASAPSLEFWHNVVRAKLEVVKLNEDSVPFFGTIGPSTVPDLSARVSFDASVLSSRADLESDSLERFLVEGSLFLPNTMDAFSNTDFDVSFLPTSLSLS